MAKQRLKLVIPGSHGLNIAAVLETPELEPKAYVLYAHCFTCGKDNMAASRVSRGMVAQGFAVMRLDFTGIGASDGEFADSNFSSNVQDLKHCSDYLREHYQAPSILIGHSFGGAAVLAAAGDIEEVAGVVTIAAPSNPRHVCKQFIDDIDTIETQGEALVSLSGRPFTIKKQFLDDLALQNQDEKIKKLKKPLLIFHSPVDQTVLIKEAEHIYNTAMHPKSFVSLDSADHLLTKAKDAQYVSASIAAWVSLYLSE